MSLETMYKNLSDELIQINNALRNDPNWQPTKPGTSEVDELTYKSAKMIYDYLDPDSYSILSNYGITLQDIENDTGDFAEIPNVFKKVLKTVYDTFKTFKADNRQNDIKKILKDIAATAPEEHVSIIHPDTGATVVTLYSADFKALVSNLLKKIIEEPIKLPQAFIDAWTKVMQIVGPLDLSNKELDTIIAEIMGKNTAGLGDLFNF
jgi:hypothetical protein